MWQGNAPSHPVAASARTLITWAAFVYNPNLSDQPLYSLLVARVPLSSYRQPAQWVTINEGLGRKGKETYYQLTRDIPSIFSRATVLL